MNKNTLNIFYFLTLIINLIGCQRPTTREYITPGNSSGGTTIVYTTTEEEALLNAEDLTVQKNTGETTTFGSAVTENPDLLNCTWSQDGLSNYVYHHESIGSYNACFVESKNIVYIQMKTPQNGQSLCFFPTTSQDSSSTYVGEASCINMSSSKTIYPIQLYKNRSGYESYSITGVMIMYDIPHSFGYPYYQVLLIPDAYLYCMNYLVYSLYYNDTPDTSYCDTFTAAKKYVYHTFN